MSLLPMSDVRAYRLAEALYPPHVLLRLLWNAAIVAAAVGLGYALGAWRATAYYDPPELVWPLAQGLHTEISHGLARVRFLRAAPEISVDGGPWRECR